MATLEAIRARYFRPTSAKPDGEFAHHGDCLVFPARICSCGLLHDLMPMGLDKAVELYPAYEKDLDAQDAAIQILAPGIR